jgi:hypothetical protein
LLLLAAAAAAAVLLLLLKDTAFQNCPSMHMISFRPRINYAFFSHTSRL